jgi:hypothetical protein
MLLLFHFILNKSTNWLTRTQLFYIFDPFKRRGHEMKTSETISEIATAMSKAQGAIEDATKKGLNPAFRSKYADMAAVRAVIREPLAENDLSVVQFPRTSDGAVEVETMILHKSGEYFAETLRMPVHRFDAHGIGSAITYARRYGLMSMLSLASEDDDGNASVQQVAAPKKNIDTAPILAAGEKAAGDGNAALSVWWKKLTPDERNALDPNDVKALKAIAIGIDKKDEE